MYKYPKYTIHTMEVNFFNIFEQEHIRTLFKQWLQIKEIYLKRNTRKCAF